MRRCTNLSKFKADGVLDEKDSADSSRDGGLRDVVVFGCDDI
jgi:hypothetical protein